MPLQNRRQMFSDDRFVVNAEILNNALKLLKSDGTTITFAGGGSSTQVQANWTETDTTSKAYILNKPSLSTVATSGSYNDLSNRPTIPSISATTSNGLLKTLTINEDEYDVTNLEPIYNASYKITGFNVSGTTRYIYQPDVPTKTSELTNDSGFIDRISQFNLTSFTYALPVTGYSDGVYVLTRTGSSSGNPGHSWDLLNSTKITNALGYTPYNATNPSGYISSITSAMVTNALGYTPVEPSVLADYLTIPSISTAGNYALTFSGAEVISGWTKLSSVATSGSYTDLSDKPTIPSATTVTAYTPTLSWGSTSSIITVNGYTATVTMPSKFTSVASQFTIGTTSTSSSCYLSILSATSYSPYILLGKGTASDTYSDWKIQNNGNLAFTYSKSGTTRTFAIMNVSTVTAPYFDLTTVPTMLRFNKIQIPTTSGGSTYDVGSSGQVLMSNGTTVYWGSVGGGGSTYYRHNIKVYDTNYGAWEVYITAYTTSNTAITSLSALDTAVGISNGCSCTGFVSDMYMGSAYKCEWDSMQTMFTIYLFDSNDGSGVSIQYNDGQLDISDTVVS